MMGAMGVIGMMGTMMGTLGVGWSSVSNRNGSSLPKFSGLVIVIISTFYR